MTLVLNLLATATQMSRRQTSIGWPQAEDVIPMRFQQRQFAPRHERHSKLAGIKPALAATTTTRTTNADCPIYVPTVTGLMRRAGYFVSNGRGVVEDKKNAKSHLNFIYEPKTFFDGVDWSQRAEGQPFFAQVQIKEPHRAFVKADRIRTDAPIPPYYPEHPVTRADWSNYLASIEELDRKVGAVLDRLESEDEIANTFILFFGDHGRPHARGKQWLYDGGNPHASHR